MTENNKGQTIFLSVIGIATLLVAIVGATFAWFSTTLNGEGGSASVTTATVSALSLSGIEIAAGENVLPGWESAQSEFSVSGTVTGNVTVPYTCTISNEVTGANAITDLEYRVSTADGDFGNWTKVSAASEIEGSITASNASDVYKFQIRFPETGADQNAQQNGGATVSVSCAIEGTTVYYTTGSANGTTTMPSAQ